MFRLLCVSVLLVGCAPEGAKPAPPPIVFEQDALVPGERVTFSVTGASPTDTVYFGYSTAGTGAGPCIASLGVCLELLAPLALLGTAVADGSGVAELTLRLPDTLPPQFVHSQAVLSGPAGALATDTISAPILAGGLDEDGDGFCAGTACADPSLVPGDCNDLDADVYPGQGAWFDSPHWLEDGTSSFDYDCDGQEALRWTERFSCAPATSGLLPGFSNPVCDDSEDGWTRRPPACGEEQSWGRSCQTFASTSTSGICLPGSSVQRTQRCR